MSTEIDEVVQSEPNRGKHLRTFFWIVLCLTVIRLLLGFVGVPIPLIRVASEVVTVIFMVLPFLALYAGAAGLTKPATAIGLVVAGGLAHAGGALALENGLVAGPSTVVVVALAQVGLMMWCLGLGYLVALAIKDKNLLIPLSIFMAAFDIFLVLTPVGPTQKLMKVAPKFHQAVSMSVPSVAEAPTTAPVAPAAFVGPADLLFVAMFFVVLFRFNMRTRTTLLAVVPTLVLYMVATKLLGPLPALVPIGLCVLIVNWKEFKLTKDEWMSTAVITVLLGGLLAWGLTRPKSPAEPLKPDAGQGAPKQGDSPAPVSGGQSR